MRPRVRFCAALLTLTAAGAGCGSDNVADCDKGRPGVPCSERTADEEARLAIDDGDYTRAIELLTVAIEEEPENYDRYPLLAAAYAARGGFDLFKFASSGSSAAGGGSAMAAVNLFLPDPVAIGAEAYAEGVDDIGRSVDVLKAIPLENLGETSAAAYAASALVQLTIYQSAYSFMLLQKYAVSATTGALDISQLDRMSEEEALAVIENLTDVTQLPQVAGNAEVQAKVQAALDAINSNEDADTREKLKAYLEAQQAADQAGGDSGDPAAG